MALNARGRFCEGGMRVVPLSARIQVYTSPDSPRDANEMRSSASYRCTFGDEFHLCEQRGLSHVVFSELRNDLVRTWYSPWTLQPEHDSKERESVDSLNHDSEDGLNSDYRQSRLHVARTHQCCLRTALM